MNGFIMCCRRNFRLQSLLLRSCSQSFCSLAVESCRSLTARRCNSGVARGRRRGSGMSAKIIIYCCPWYGHSLTRFRYAKHPSPHCVGRGVVLEFSIECADLFTFLLPRYIYIRLAPRSGERDISPQEKSGEGAWGFFLNIPTSLLLASRMTSKEIRQSFLDFLRARGHEIVPSAPVIPHGDKTLLFTNAGMNQFKDVFLGTGSRSYTRAADTQKVIRVSGKHNDLEEVGHDTYHHTFFEMLGNWSFGDYYKKEAIGWAWELLTSVWKLDKSRLYATVYETDDESFEMWKSATDIDPTHILRFGAKDNFWEMGDTGPCGPCSEIHYDHTPDKSGGALVNAGDPRVIEIWNLVFIQYNRSPDGSLEELPMKHVDTGMGFERACAVLQNKGSNYDTDVFEPYIHWLAKKTTRSYGSDEKSDIAMRVIADHIRTLTTAIADGALPGKEGRGYVLRRILRRAVRYGRNLGFSEPFLF